MLTIMVAIAVVIVLLLAVSAFFSGSETALTGANPARLHLLAAEDRDGTASGGRTGVGHGRARRTSILLLLKLTRVSPPKKTV